MIMELGALLPGQSCVVQKVGCCGALEARLRDFGLISGTQVVCDYCSPDGKLMALVLRGTVLALRRADLGGIQVRLYE